MVRTIRARFSYGVIEPLEKVEMPERSGFFA
ncbi:antitoxin AF2212-like protein [Candidatus Kuenenia sp.]